MKVESVKDFIEIEVTPEMLKAAQIKAEQLGELRNSIRRGEGNLGGFLGEEAVLSAFPAAIWDSTFDYDIDIRGFKFDVKTKERTTFVPPPIDYMCSIPRYNTAQKADFYIFVSLHNRVTAYIVGYIKKTVYFKQAKYMQKGEIDPANNFVEKAGSYQLPISELWPIRELYQLPPSGLKDWRIS